MLPTFLGIGASRSGTTAVYDYLYRHSQVFVPDTKEIHFFTFLSERCGAKTPMERVEYEALFPVTHGCLGYGEISPSYLWVPGTAESIRALIPDVKLIVILRNPVERAISDFQYSWKYGRNQCDFSGFVNEGLTAIHRDQLLLNPFHPSAVLWKGCYAAQLTPYLERFDRENIKIFLQDDLEKDSSGVSEQLCRFLNIPHNPELSLLRVNARQQTGVIPADQRHKLVDFYMQDIERLEKMLGLDLEHWKWR